MTEAGSNVSMTDADRIKTSLFSIKTNLFFVNIRKHDEFEFYICLVDNSSN